jgi:hypothetical protein
MSGAVLQPALFHHPWRLQVREANEDLELRGMRVPKGTEIHVAVCAIQRDPDVWRQPVRRAAAGSAGIDPAAGCSVMPQHDTSVLAEDGVFAGGLCARALDRRRSRGGKRGGAFGVDGFR